MKILIDTNILFSAILFEHSKVAKTLFYINKHHDIYLSDQNIQELRRIIRTKAPHKSTAIELFLAKLAYEIIPAADISPNKSIIRDPKDQPILSAAIINDIDIIITGDKDFLVLNLDKPKCMTITEFCNLENIN